MPAHCKKDQMILWASPPAVADATQEELLKARHKRTDLFHVVVIPQLMTLGWWQLFNKVCDYSFIVSPSTSFWPADMFKPLWVGVILPFSHCRPWSLKQAPLLVEMGRDLQSLLKTESFAETFAPPKKAGQPVRTCGMWHVLHSMARVSSSSQQ